MKKSTKTLLSLFASVSLLAACGGNNETGESSEPTNESPVTQVGGTIKIGLAANPNSLDPTAYTGQYESNVIRQIGDTLVIYSDDFSEFKPSLATEWSVSEDGLTY